MNGCCASGGAVESLDLEAIGGRRIARGAAALIGAVAVTVALASNPAPIVIPSGADARSQLNPVAAYDGKGVVLLVWQQGRRYYEQQQGDILAVRLDRSGKVLDANPIVVSGASESQEMPQVEFANGVFLVVWQDFRSGSRWEVYGARIDASGRVLDPSGIPIATSSTNAALPQVAEAPSGFLVAWQSLEGRHYQLRAALVSDTGSVSAQPLSHSGEPLYGGSPTIARLRSGWLLAWNDERAWVVATGMITRRAAWLRDMRGKAVVADVEAVPAFARNSSDVRMFAAPNAAMFTGWGSDGRGERVAAAAIYRDGRAAPIQNPNDDRRPGSGVDVSRMIRAFPGMDLVDGPVAGDFGCGRYMLVTRTLPARARSPYRLIAMRLAPDGRRLDVTPPVVAESDTAIGDPALTSVGDDALLVYEQETASGRRILRARLLEGMCTSRP